MISKNIHILLLSTLVASCMPAVATQPTKDELIAQVITNEAQQMSNMSSCIANVQNQEEVIQFKAKITIIDGLTTAQLAEQDANTVTALRSVLLDYIDQIKPTDIESALKAMASINQQAYESFNIEDLALYATHLSLQNLYWDRLNQDGWNAITFLMLYIIVPSSDDQQLAEQCVKLLPQVSQIVLEDYESADMVALRTKINNYGWAQKTEAEQETIVQNLSEQEKHDIDSGVLVGF